MPQTHNGVKIPVGADLAYGPQAFSDAVDNGNMVSIFANNTERDAWASPPDGVLGYVRSPSALYERIGNAWVQVGVTVLPYATVAARDAAMPAPAPGTWCITLDTGTLWIGTVAHTWAGPKFDSLAVTAVLSVGGAATVAGLITGQAGATIAGTASLTTLDVAGGSTLHGQAVFGVGGDGVIVKTASPDGVILNLAAPALINNGPWNNRPIVITQQGANSGAGIGFNAAGSAVAGVFQFFGPTGSFTCNNGGNNGYVPIVASAFTVASSRRYKEQVTDADPDIDFDSLRPVTFVLIDGDGQRRLGFVAEEVAEVIPDVVYRDGEGRPEGVDYGALVPVLVAEIQHLRQRVSDLEAA